MTQMKTLRKRLPVILSATALVVAVFGSTPLGHAVQSVVPFANHAEKADFAKNAGAVNGIKASRQPKAGQLVPLGSDGRFPASVGLGGQPGPQGARGETGPAGPRGPAGPAAGRPQGSRRARRPSRPAGPGRPERDQRLAVRDLSGYDGGRR